MSSEIQIPSFGIETGISAEKTTCKRCKGEILFATAIKYEGYSAQCYKKHLAEIKPIVETELSKEEIKYYLSKTVIKPIKLYSFKEYCYLYAIKERKKYYYLKYVLRCIQVAKTI